MRLPRITINSVVITTLNAKIISVKPETSSAFRKGNSDLRASLPSSHTTRAHQNVPQKPATTPCTMPKSCMTHGGNAAICSLNAFAWSALIFPAATCWSIAFSCISTICCLIVGWDNVTANDVMVINITIRTGTNQLATDEFAVFNPSNTSPGAAKTFNNRPASELEGRWSFSAGIDGGTFSMWVLAEAGRVSGSMTLGKWLENVKLRFACAWGVSQFLAGRM